MRKQQYTDLTGDPVYDQLASQLIGENKLLGGRIIEKTTVEPKEAKKVIEVKAIHGKSGIKTEFSYNYNKLFRDFTKEGKI